MRSTDPVPCAFMRVRWEDIFLHAPDPVPSWRVSRNLLRTFSLEFLRVRGRHAVLHTRHSVASVPGKRPLPRGGRVGRTGTQEARAHRMSRFEDFVTHE